MMSEKKEDRRVRRTKKLLTQALTQLMQEKQIKDITVRELADLADVNRGTFYLYYRDIFDMLEKIEMELFERFHEIIASHQEGRILSQARPVFSDLFHFIAENQEICRILLSDNGDMKFLQRLSDVVEERVRTDWLKHPDGLTEMEFEYRYSFGVLGCVGLVRAWLENHCSEAADDMAALADCLIRQGIAPALSTAK